MAVKSSQIVDNDEELDQNASPKDVLYEQMDFFRRRAMRLGNEIAKKLKQEGAATELVQLYKVMVNVRKDIIDVATKLAPFEHAKLQSVEVAQKIEHRFVIRAPQVTKSADEFFRFIGKSKNTDAISDSATPFDNVTVKDEMPHLKNTINNAIKNTQFSNHSMTYASDDEELEDYRRLDNEE